MAFKTRAPREPLDEPRLYDYAVGALGRRMRTVAELRRLMVPRVEKGETGTAKIDAVLRRLADQRYLDDRTYAADYTRLRQEGAKLGRRRVQQDLQRKGVDGEVVSATLDRAYEGMDEVELARQFAERKRMRKPENEKETARAVRRFLGAGFSLGSAYKLLRRWEAPDEALAMLEQVEDGDALPPDGE